ncbi:hypothetical protein ACLOJK_038991 [Asimina triloba]
MQWAIIHTQLSAKAPPSTHRPDDLSCPARRRRRADPKSVEIASHLPHVRRAPHHDSSFVVSISGGGCCSTSASPPTNSDVSLPRYRSGSNDGQSISIFPKSRRQQPIVSALSKPASIQQSPSGEQLLGSTVNNNNNIPFSTPTTTSPSPFKPTNPSPLSQHVKTHRPKPAAARPNSGSLDQTTWAPPDQQPAAAHFSKSGDASFSAGQQQTSDNSGGMQMVFKLLAWQSIQLAFPRKTTGHGSPIRQRPEAEQSRQSRDGI